jgi:hypothetical protein
MRYFRSSPAVYANICTQLDAAYSYPNAETKTARALPLVSELPSDARGRVYLAISQEHCEYILPSEMLPQLLASGAVEEVSEAAYRALLPTPH